MRKLLRVMPLVLILALVIASPALVNANAAGEITKLVFTTEVRTITPDIASEVMTIQTQDTSGNPANVTADTIINLSSTSGTGRFDISAEGAFDGSITSLTIPNGSNSANFHYKDAAVGTPAITAAEAPDQGWADAMQQETITAFEVTNLIITPASPKEGETINISAMVTNNGTETGSYTAQLKINGEVASSQEVTLEPGANQTVSFAITKDAAGDYQVEIDGLSGVFTVKTSLWAMFPPYMWVLFGVIAGILLMLIIFLITTPRKRAAKPAAEAVQPATKAKAERPAEVPVTAPSFEVSNLTINPSQVKQGEAVTITAQVTNSGGMSGSHKLALRINGRVIATKEVKLEPGASNVLGFNVTETMPGDYLVEIDGLNGVFSIPAAAFNVTDLEISPTRVKERQNITISATVTNSGGASGTHALLLKIKDKIEASQEITLSPGERQKVSFMLSKDKSGYYPVELGGLQGKFAVEMAEFTEEL